MRHALAGFGKAVMLSNPRFPRYINPATYPAQEPAPFSNAEVLARNPVTREIPRAYYAGFAGET